MPSLVTLIVQLMRLGKIYSNELLHMSISGFYGLWALNFKKRTKQPYTLVKNTVNSR